MIINTPPPTEALRGIQKAAVLLVALGDQASAEIIKHMQEDEIAALGQAVVRLSSVTSEQAEHILEEFHQLTVAQEFVARGGMDYAKKMLMTAFGPEVAKRLIDRLAKSLGADGASFDALQKADPQQLAKFIHNEHPQTVALILSHLNPSQAAALLVSLPQRIRADVAFRMANLDQISPEIITISPRSSARSSPNSANSAANPTAAFAPSPRCSTVSTPPAARTSSTDRKQDPNLSETIRHLMFVFEDLLLIDHGIKEILGRIDRKVLTVA